MKKSKTKNSVIFKQDIKKIFNLNKWDDYKENQKERTIRFTYSDNGVTFDQLEKLSNLLQTKNINFVGATKEYAYSEITFDSEIEGEIHASNVIFPQEVQ